MIFNNAIYWRDCCNWCMIDLYPNIPVCFEATLCSRHMEIQLKTTKMALLKHLYMNLKIYPTKKGIHNIKESY